MRHDDSNDNHTEQPEPFCEMTGGYDDVDHARAAKRLNADLRAMDATPRGKQTTRIPVTLPCGKQVFWTVWRDAKVHLVNGSNSYTGPMWSMRDHEGYERGMEVTWAATVARIRHIADCYGCRVMISDNADMLEACEAAMQGVTEVSPGYFTIGGNAVAILRAAIARATR